MTDQITKDVVSILTDLNKKFSKNLQTSLLHERERIQHIELKARAFITISNILIKEPNLNAAQKELTCIFDEIFADIICSVYFASCSLDRPAGMLLRKVLELGVGLFYMWDMPHWFWAWKDHDRDLNFTEMILHLGSDGYKTLVAKENPNFHGKDVIDCALVKSLYRSLSDTVHGKIKTFESLVKQRFNFNLVDWSNHLKIVEDVEDLLLKAFRNRFTSIGEKLEKEQPSITIAK